MKQKSKTKKNNFRLNLPENKQVLKDAVCEIKNPALKGMAEKIFQAKGGNAVAFGQLYASFSKSF